MVFWLPHLVLEVVLDGHDILLIGAVSFLFIIVAAVSNCDPLMAPVLPLLPFLPPLSPFLAPLQVALDGATRLLLWTIFPSPRTKTALTPSSPETCRVAISNNPLVVFGQSWLSSCTKVQ
jgi:hypothetical protein